MRKSKALALLSFVIAAAVLGIVVLSVSATGDATASEGDPAPAFWRRFCNGWLDSLDDSQRAQLQALVEENRGEVMALLDAWGVELPEFQGPRGLRSSLSDEQRDELRTMRQDFRDAVRAKLDEWGVDAPEFHGGGGCRGRYLGGFGLFRP
jgi:hypothetical protein